MTEEQTEQAKSSAPEGLRSLCSAITDLRCSAWRKGYGFTGSLHFGRMLPVGERHPGSVDVVEGEMMLDLWDCDRVLLRPNGEVLLDSRVNREEVVLDVLHRIEGLQVSKVELDERELSLRVPFSDGHALVLLLNREHTAEDDEQWAVQAAGETSVGIFGLGLIRWTDGRDTDSSA